MRSLSSIQSQLKALGASGFVLRRGEVKCLPKILHYDESIKAFIYGSHVSGFGLMVATDKRLIFLNKMLIDLTVDDVPYGVLQGVEYGTGLRYGSVKVFMPAKNFEFTYVKKAYVLPFVNYVQQRIMEFQDRRAPIVEESSQTIGDMYRREKPIMSQFKQSLNPETKN